MKQLHQLSARHVLVGMIGWLIATDLFIGLAHISGGWVWQTLAFLCLSFLPGAVIMRLLHAGPGNHTTRVLYSFGLSVLVLMLSGLAGNQILPIFGITRPLAFWGTFAGWNIATLLLIGGSWWLRPQPLRFRQPLQLPAFRQIRSGKSGLGIKISRLAILFVGASLLLPCLAIFGAFRLNNGGDALFAELALGYAVVLIIGIFALRRRLPDGLLAWMIFVLGLSVLLMTSLRGWDIVGHDIEHEFRVYTLLHSYGRWNIGLERDPYNACLSITILPEMFAKLLNLSGLTVFKVILQVVFATCPAAIYVLLRRHVSKLGALLGCLLFLCYPTFVNDSAMLTRQGVAYLFFTLAVLVLATKKQHKRHKLLFVLFSLGVVLSHYSTAYMFVALFGVAVVCKTGVAQWHYRRPRVEPNGLARPVRTTLSYSFAVLLFLMTFAWYSQITATSSGLVTTLRQSFTDIPKLFSNDNKSSDTSVALVFGSSKTVADPYLTYLAKSQSARATSAAKAPQYMPILINDYLPLTKLGNKALSVGINPTIISTLRQNFAKVLQLLALVGVLYAVYRLLRKKPDAIGTDLVCLSLASILLLALLVVLPVLSINYGVLRAFQQALILLVIPMLVLVASLTRRLPGWSRNALAIMITVFLFLLFNGLFAQILGGTSPSLSLNNQGLYFGLYYATEADARAFAWLKTNVSPTSDVRAENFNKAFMHDPSYPFSASGILPFQVTPGTYVYVDPNQVLGQKLYTHYSDEALIMTFPLGYYFIAKNQVYSTTSTGIYR